jgi:tetratricopeptide (TPR) repeat protein
MLHALFAVSLVGFSSHEPKVAEAAAPAPQAIDSKESLALAPTSENTAVDKLIASQETAARKNPNKAELWTTLGRSWIRKARESQDPGFYLHADACADIALGIAEGDRGALDLRAVVLLNQHRFEDARQLSQQIVSKRPDDPMAYGNLSDALLELGRFDEAALAAQTMVDLKPNLPSYARAAHFRFLAGDVASAKQFYKAAADSGADQRDPEPRAWVLVQAANVFWSEGDNDGADAGFDLALRGLSDYPPALVGKARVALARGNAAEAASLAQRAYDQAPHAETAWLLGDALEAQGKTDDAKKAFALVEKDGRRGDKRTLAMFWSTKNVHAKEALDLAQDEKKTRGDIVMDDTLAWALYRNGRFAEARAASDRAIAHGTRDAKLWFHAGAIRMAQSQEKEGRDFIDRSLALQPHFDQSGAKEALDAKESRAQARR